MAINIPRSPISQAATQRRSLLPAQEASRIAKSFKSVVDTAQEISMDYYDKKAQVEAGNFNSNLKTFSEQQEKSFQDSARSIGMSEQEDPMDREAQLFELGQTYIDNLKTFVDTETENMGPLAKKRLAPQMQKALTNLRKDPSGLMLDLTSSMEKGQIDSIKQRALGDYQEYPTDDLPNQIIKDFNELKAFEDLGRISTEEVKNLEKYTVNNISNAYGLGAKAQTQLAVDIMSGKFNQLPKPMVTDLNSFVLSNLPTFVKKADVHINTQVPGQFEINPQTGNIEYKSPDKSTSEDLIFEFINGLNKLNFTNESNELTVSVATGQASQAFVNSVGQSAASLQNWLMGNGLNPMISPKMSTHISSLYAENPEFQMGQEYSAEDLLKYDQAAGGLPGFVIDQINNRIKQNDIQMFETMYEFMGDAKAFKAADSTSEDFAIEPSVMKRIVEYNTLRKSVPDPVSAFNAHNSEEPKGSGGGGASGPGGVSGSSADERAEELVDIIGENPEFTLNQQTYLVNTIITGDQLSFMQADYNPFITLDKKMPIGALLAWGNLKATTKFVENGNILVNGLLDPEKTDSQGTLAWVQDEIIRQLDANPSKISNWETMPKDTKKTFISGAVLERTEEGFYKIALDPEQTQEIYPTFIEEFYLDLNYKNSMAFRISKHGSGFGSIELQNGVPLHQGKKLSELTAEQAADVVVQGATGGMNEPYFDPQNAAGRVAETALGAVVKVASVAGTEVWEEIEYGVGNLWNLVIANISDDPTETWKNLRSRDFEQGKLGSVDRVPEVTVPQDPIPPFLMVPRFRNMYHEIIHTVVNDFQNPGSYEITNGVQLNPTLSRALDRLKNVFTTASPTGQENFLQLILQNAKLSDDFQTVVMDVANKRFQERLKQVIIDDPTVINEFTAPPNVQAQFRETFTTNFSLEDYAKGRISLITSITDTQTIPEIVKDVLDLADEGAAVLASFVNEKTDQVYEALPDRIIKDPLIQEPLVKQILDDRGVQSVFKRVEQLIEELSETGNTFVQMLTGRGPKGQKFRKTLEDSAVGQLADLPVDFATAAKDSFDSTDFDSFWPDTMKVVEDVTVGYGELAGSTIKVLAYDLWKQIIEQSPKGSLPVDENAPFYKAIGEIVGGAAEGAWSTVRTLYYDAPKAMGKAFMDSQMGKELKPVFDVAEEVFDAGSEIAGGAAGLAGETLKFPFALIEDLSEATAKQPPVDTKDKMKSLTESAFGRIVIDTSKGFIDLYTETLKVPYMILEQWPKTKSPEKVTGAVKPVNPFPSLENRFMGQLRMNVDVRMENGVEISIPGQAQINNGMLRVVPDNPRYSNLLNGQNIEIKINPITPIQDALGQSIQFGSDALPSIPTTKFGKPYVPEDLESNVEQWKKDNADFNTMPRKDGSYYPSNYDMDVRNVQRFVSSNEPKAIREISKMLYASIDSEDKDFLFVSGLIKKPKGARKGWYGKYYTTESQKMLESYGQNPNAALKTMQTGLSQVMPGNSTVFILGLTNQQFFSLVEDLHNLYEMESK